MLHTIAKDTNVFKSHCRPLLIVGRPMSFKYSLQYIYLLH
uniref:Uncharacterized protein n=1 Tax=Anguilla anguilla TaxID=7936 RepID=A0A0E9RMR1_ANGAN